MVLEWHVRQLHNRVVFCVQDVHKKKTRRYTHFTPLQLYGMPKSQPGNKALSEMRKKWDVSLLQVISSRKNSGSYSECHQCILSLLDAAR